MKKMLKRLKKFTHHLVMKCRLGVQRLAGVSRRVAEKYRPAVKKLVTPVAVTFTGAYFGAKVVFLSGFTAIGLVGGGTGIGAAAGPVGMVFGALLGLAAYGLVRVAVDICHLGREKIA